MKKKIKAEKKKKLKYSWSMVLVSSVLYNDLTSAYVMKLITMINLVTMYPHTKLSQYYWYHIPMTYLLCNWRFASLNPLYLFHPLPHPSLLATTCFLYLCVHFYFVLVFTLDAESYVSESSIFFSNLFY